MWYRIFTNFIFTAHGFSFFSPAKYNQQCCSREILQNQSRRYSISYFLHYGLLLAAVKNRLNYLSASSGYRSNKMKILTALIS
jgi:hypothetical protein